MKEKVVLGIVIKNKNVLIVKRKKQEDNILWQFPGGTIEQGETVEEALIRELKEETGIQVKIIKYLGERIHPYTKKHMIYFACKYIAGNLYISDHELEQVKWVAIPDLGHYFNSSVFDKVDHYLKNVADTI